jgi:hypothetical protein
LRGFDGTIARNRKAQERSLQLTEFERLRAAGMADHATRVIGV